MIDEITDEVNYDDNFELFNYIDSNKSKLIPFSKAKLQVDDIIICCSILDVAILKLDEMLKLLELKDNKKTDKKIDKIINYLSNTLFDYRNCLWTKAIRKDK